MWEFYARFAPNPLMLNSGIYDFLFPADVFLSMMRKVRSVYAQIGHPDQLTISLTQTRHPWDEEDIDAIAEFFRRHFHSDLTHNPLVEEISLLEPGCRFAYPADAIDINQLAGQILGVETDERTTFVDAYPPTYHRAPVEQSRLANDIFASDPMRILAQMEFALIK